MAELLGVELARPGTWNLAIGGKTEFTVDMLRDAADFFVAAGAQPLPVGLGHLDSRFDGDPAFGWVGNVRYAEDEPGHDPGPVLLGDVKDVPEWLHAAAPSRWPNRSIEGLVDVDFDGRSYGLALTRLAFLGSTPPAMQNLRSLANVQQAIAAARRIAASTQISAASDKPWSQFSQADYTPEQWRRACLVDTDMGETDSKARYKLPVREPGGALNRNGVHAAASRINHLDVPAEKKMAAARALVRAYGELGEEPPESLRRIAASITPTMEGAGMNLAKYREALAGLPDTASEDEVRAALSSAGLVVASAPPTPPPPAPQPEPEPEPQPAPSKPVQVAGTMTIDASAWQEREERIKRLEAQDAKRRREERDQVIAAAVQDGKFPPARKEHWVRLWDADPEGTRQVVAGLARNVVPVMASGYASDGDDSDIDAEFAHLYPPTYNRQGA